MNRQPQTEEITWYPYPEYTPKGDWVYCLVTFKDNTTGFQWSLEDCGWRNVDNEFVIAWAEMPKGYSQRTQSANVTSKGHEEECPDCGNTELHLHCPICGCEWDIPKAETLDDMLDKVTEENKHGVKETEPVIIEWHGTRIVKISSVGTKFQKWLYGQTLPHVNEESNPLDWAYMRDYERFINGLPIID